MNVILLFQLFHGWRDKGNLYMEATIFNRNTWWREAFKFYSKELSIGELEEGLDIEWPSSFVGMLAAMVALPS